MPSPADPYFKNVTTWHAEVNRLREIMLACGLGEELKWGKPCYSKDGHNVVIIQTMKQFVALLFFRGSLLKDRLGLLEKPGPNSRVGRRFRFTQLQQIDDLAETIHAYIHEAIGVQQAGLKVDKGETEEWVTELQTRLAADAAFKNAFEALTPGRQRAYNLHFAGAKQSSTRERRVEKYAPKILKGKGLQDRD